MKRWFVFMMVMVAAACVPADLSRAQDDAEDLRAQQLLSAVRVPGGGESRDGLAEMSEDSRVRELVGLGDAAVRALGDAMRRAPRDRALRGLAAVMARDLRRPGLAERALREAVEDAESTGDDASLRVVLSVFRDWPRSADDELMRRADAALTSDASVIPDPPPTIAPPDSQRAGLLRSWAASLAQVERPPAPGVVRGFHVLRPHQRDLLYVHLRPDDLDIVMDVLSDAARATTSVEPDDLQGMMLLASAAVLKYQDTRVGGEFVVDMLETGIPALQVVGAFQASYTPFDEVRDVVESLARDAADAAVRAHADRSLAVLEQSRLTTWDAVGTRGGAGSPGVADDRDPDAGAATQPDSGDADPPGADDDPTTGERTRADQDRRTGEPGDATEPGGGAPKGPGLIVAALVALTVGLAVGVALRMAGRRTG